MDRRGIHDDPSLPGPVFVRFKVDRYEGIIRSYLHGAPASTDDTERSPFSYRRSQARIVRYLG